MAGHSYITMVGKAGVSPREHQDLARHSTYALTSRYSHSRFYDLAAAVNGLPSILPPERAPDAGVGVLAATGTDYVQGCVKPAAAPGPRLDQTHEDLGDFLRLAEAEHCDPPEPQNPGKQAALAVFQGSGENPSQMEPTGIEPVTSAL